MGKLKHGKSNTKLYGIWLSMKNRCLLQTDKQYGRYGGRGITVCPEWLGEHGFENFYDWAMSVGYDESKSRVEQSIDRIDVNGNYEPDNCRFASAKVQSNNRRSNHFLEFRGETHTIKEWSEITGIKNSTIERRLNEYGWSIEDSLTIKPYGWRRK